jgi:ribosomal protein S27AE
MKHKPVKQSDMLKVANGKIERNRRNCPRCGDEVKMAQHKEKEKTRFYCGKCHMSIWE